ncbi:MAG TPA: dihydrodipicolinate synthase family protein [Clostridia bacterium]|nr:dihydrodipicolinate synthase family protein [Clostridia bacterium]
MLKTIPNGVYPTMVTPYNENNTIDYNAVEQLLDWYVKKNVDGIFTICQSSEIFYLTFEERLELLRFIMKNIPKGVSIVASGHTADDLKTQINEAKAFIQEGIDAYVFISNRFANQNDNDSVFLKNIEVVCNSIDDIALGIYECPYPYKRLIEPKILKELAQNYNFRFLKDTCCDLRIIGDKLKAVEGTNLKIFNANSATLLESLKIGCSGFSGVMANFHPEIYSWLCKNYKTEPEKAKLVQDFVGFFSLAECQTYPVNAKYYLSLEGLEIGYKSRAKSSDDFTRARQMEIEQMHRLTEHFKNKINLK